MQVDIGNLIVNGDKIAVALSGGSDSMALLNYMLSLSEKFGFSVIALNVEHGIRGESSIRDTEFVKDYCHKHNIELLTYSVDSLKKADQEKLSLEQAARFLRYECFFDAINSKKCTKVATAHHLDDNAESVLFNLFRGTGIKGATGIERNFDGKIIRPFLSVKKEDIKDYVIKNNIPYVTDDTNFCCDYTRNALRLKVIPEIKKLFPKMQDGLLRFAEILKDDNDFLEIESQKILTLSSNKAEITIPCHRALFSRATISALKSLGVKKDYEKVHVDDAYSLISKQNGSSINLPLGITAIREYDKIVFYKKSDQDFAVIPFSIGKFSFGESNLEISVATNPDLKSGFYLDLDKIPTDAVIRTRKDGDVFTKFGGGTKSLGDYLTDKKIPLKERESLALVASKNDVLAIFGVAISNTVKIDDNTKNIIQLIKK